MREKDGGLAITYAGSFPPPYGGVTVKNDLLCRCLSERVSIDKLDLGDVKRLDPKACLVFLRCLFSRNGILIVGAAGEWRRRITNILYRVNMRKMKRSILVVMGGRTVDDSSYMQRLNCFKRVYVETESMKEQWEEHGAANVSIYPNCRLRHGIPVVPSCVQRESLGAVFCSLVCKDKGADIVLGAAASLPEVGFHFYGQIEEDYEDEFADAVSRMPNVHYHGIFNSAEDDVVEELSKYDVHLFPTRCPNEGVPGIIVETKIAGIPTIAASVSYNQDLIEDAKDGFLMQQNTAEELVYFLRILQDDSAQLASMRKNARASAEAFYADRYIDEIVRELNSSD